MTFWQVAGESAVGVSVAVLVFGTAFIVLAAWLFERWTLRPLLRRATWRGVALAAGLWGVLELTGGTAGLARWIGVNEVEVPAAARSDRAPPSAIARDRMPTDRAGRIPEGPRDPHMGHLPPDGVMGFKWSPVLEPLSSAATAGRKPLPHAEIEASSLPEMKEIRESDHGSAQPRTSRRALPQRPPRYLAWLVGGWLAGAAVVTAWFASRRLSVFGFTRLHTSPAPRAVRRLARSVAYRMTGRGFARPNGSAFCGPRRIRRLRIVQSDRLSSPVVYGVLRPTLAVPGDLAETLPRDQLAAVLAHELVHVMGRDSLWQAVFDTLAVLLWWHPCVWLARTRHRAACEAAADCGAAALPGGSRALAAALVRLARELSSRPWLGWAVLGPSRRFRSRLSRRVVRLLSDDFGMAAFSSPRAARALCCATAVLLILGLLSGTALMRSHVSVSTIPIGGHPMAIWQSSWRSSLAAAAVTALLGTTAAAEEDARDDVDVEDVNIEFVAGASEEAVGELELTTEINQDGKLFFLSGGEGEAVPADEAERNSGTKDDTKENSGFVLLRAIGERASKAELQRQQARAKESLARIQEELAGVQEELAKERSQVAEQARTLVERAKAEVELRRPEITLRAHGFRLEPPNENVHHLKQAAEHLQSVGKHELAEQLLHEAKSLQKKSLKLETHVVRPEVRGAEVEVSRPKTAVRPLLMEEEEERVPPRRSPNVEELREEMNDLRSDLNEMRQMLKQVVDRLERE